MNIRAIITEQDKFDHIDYRFKIHYLQNLVELTDKRTRNFLKSVRNEWYRGIPFHMSVDNIVNIWKYKDEYYIYIYDDEKRRERIELLIQSDGYKKLFQYVYFIPVYTCYHKEIDTMFRMYRDRIKLKSTKWTYHREEACNIDRKVKKNSIIFNTISAGITILLIGIGVILAFLGVDTKWIGLVAGIFTILYTLYTYIYNIVKNYDGFIIRKNNRVRLLMINMVLWRMSCLIRMQKLVYQKYIVSVIKSTLKRGIKLKTQLWAW